MKKKEKLNDTVVGYCECPHIHLGKYCLEVVGSNLCINEFSPEGAVIEGDILSVEYSSD